MQYVGSGWGLVKGLESPTTLADLFHFFHFLLIFFYSSHTVLAKTVTNSARCHDSDWIELLIQREIFKDASVTLLHCWGTWRRGWRAPQMNCDTKQRFWNVNDAQAWFSTKQKRAWIVFDITNIVLKRNSNIFSWHLSLFITLQSFVKQKQFSFEANIKKNIGSRTSYTTLENRPVHKTFIFVFHIKNCDNIHL